LRTLIAIVFVVVLAAYPLRVMAHGVRGSVASGGVIVKAEYTTGEPMSYAKLVITAPDKKIPFQIGRTDRNGRFCFYPDMPGKWRVVLSDGMGHRLEMALPINHVGRIGTSGYIESPLQRWISKYLRAIAGVSIIFGIFGCLMGWKGYRKAKAYQTADI